MSSHSKVVEIDYTNHRGVRSTRRIVPYAISWENNEWHPETQWILEADDIEKNEVRSFACKDIHSWKAT